MKAEILIEPEPTVVETETPPLLTYINDTDGVFFDETLAHDRRIRQAVYDRLVRARQILPDYYDLVIFEAYRPRAKQISMWEDIWVEIKKTYPKDSDETLALRCNRFIANPYKHGSGHQYGCAVDINIRNNRNGEYLDMGCGLQEFCDRTETKTNLISPRQKANRMLLKTTMETVGLVNYPPEWWHYSYGDRQWAIQKGLDETLYAALSL